MKKLLSFLSLVALTFCFMSPSVYGMEDLISEDRSGVASYVDYDSDEGREREDWIPMYVDDRLYLDLPYENFTNEDLKKYSNLTSLIFQDNKITIDGLIALPKLVHLCLKSGTPILDDDLSLLTNLTDLSLWETKNISDHSIRHLTQLLYLGLKGINTITDHSLTCLIQLKELTLEKTPNVTNAALIHLTNLERLSLVKNNSPNQRTEHTHLPKLVYLSLEGNNALLDDNLSLPNLKGLYLKKTGNISDHSVRHLTKLLCLRLKDINNVTDKSLAYLTKLQRLTLEKTPNVTSAALIHLPNLEYLCTRNNNITKDEINEYRKSSFLQNLAYVYVLTADEIQQGIRREDETEPMSIDIEEFFDEK